MQIANIVTGVVELSLGLHLGLMGTFHSLLRYRRRRSSPSAPVAYVSILKPLAGYDDDLDANLESFAKLDGPRCEILFGVASTADPARTAALAFIARHPEVDARLVVTNASAAINPKIAQLIGLAAAARGDVLVVSDSNVRVGRDYLLHLLAPLADDQCGLVTSLFAGTGERTLGAALENLQLGAVITPSVVLSTLALPITVGKSMAMRRQDLERLGGFAAFGDVLAEDLALGRAFAKTGMKVETSFATVENRNVRGSLYRMFDRHARWAKMRRAIHPVCFALEPIGSPAIIAAVGAAIAPTSTNVALLATAMLVQMTTAFFATRAIRGHALPARYLPLELVRVAVLFACWLTAWSSKTVVWRGNVFAIGGGSVITPLPRRRQARVEEDRVRAA